jgi:hypothetical protein
MVFALKVSKNVLHSMRTSAKENMMTSRMLESGNTLVLKAADMDSTLSPDLLDQANFIHAKTDALNNYMQEIMVDIVQASHKDNHQAINTEGFIDLDKTNYLDNHKSTELVIFGNELEIGMGEELVEALEMQRELLQSYAGAELDGVISEMLELSSNYPEHFTWLEATFGQAPMISAMISLSNLQFKIHFLEGAILKEML